MGTKLRSLITPAIVEKQKLKHAKVVIDGTNFLIKYISTIKQNGGILFGEGGDPISHVFGFGYLVVNLLEVKIKPMVVLDGIPDEKKRLINERIQRKVVTFWRLHDGIDSSKRRQALYQNKFFLFDKIKADLRHFLTILGVPCIVAPSEAEAQASHMVKQGFADIVFSEDYDCLLYGATRWVKEFHSTDKTVKLVQLKKVLSDLNISHLQLVDLALLVGTDIYPGIRGIGPKKGLKLIKKHGFFEDIAKVVNLEVPENLEELRSYYLEPPKLSRGPLFGHPNFSVLQEYLKDKMNAKRRDKFLKRLKKAVSDFRRTQKTLF